MKTTKLNIIALFIIIILMTLPVVSALAQEDEYKYYPETDPLVLEKLEQWQDLKFGLLMHWGTYSQWGIVESWSLCPEDYGWCVREAGKNPDNYVEYKAEYENLITTFNPVEFDPEKWAMAAKNAGMKYLVFTTKHHDGFCMWDTKETDYKITSEACPFHTSEKADITKAIFDAFRAEDIWTGAYFSKPDWNIDSYWWPKFPPLDRNVNYDPADYPEQWEKFVSFTHNQIMELMTAYGQVDILWLDGGWVKLREPEQIRSYYKNDIEASSTGFIKNSWISMDIRMDELKAKAREKQPGIIVVDRAVTGPNQNYLTPENKVPEKALPYPWESCIIAGGGWSWVDPAKAHYKSVRETVHMLIDIVSKGGNLLLNIAPGPHGDWHEDAYTLLEGIGKWMDVNSEAIYGSRAIVPYKEGNICFTSKGEVLYAIYLAKEEEESLPSEVHIKSFQPEKGAKVSLLGSKVSLKWKKEGEGFVVKVPKEVRGALPCEDAWVFRF